MIGNKQLSVSNYKAWHRKWNVDETSSLHMKMMGRRQQWWWWKSRGW